MNAFASPAMRLSIAVGCLLACALAPAQQRPLTGQMLGDTAAPRTEVPATVPAPPPVPPATPMPAPAPLTPPPRPQIGDTTRALLRLQASGTQAGAHLPMLGDQASLSYARYLQSFTHPIPEFLDTSVRKDITGDGIGSGSGD
ncbi:DUF3613 domain-containing protein [Stenotrophomonas sp. BIGb0135]|uniref:DUF3613 domain-containing protein n=1 Tax=Stenotrophomonas sp. BIGb0135 TaxID=2940620 RepID=UPI002167DFA3|nr:DUF3613 domain-containing protein [Stenotrophomonas sp. BIGb0135]MCS4233249.1 hypothetical protein [Stenotrophomonas sp. BIGb0135]